MAALTLFMLTGAVGGLVAGLMLMDMSGQELSYGQGALLGITTDNDRYRQGEPVSIRVVNTGTVPLGGDTSWEFRVAGLSGMLMYNEIWADMVLEPGEDHTITWNQSKNDQSQILEGLYRISVRVSDMSGEEAVDTIVITIER